MKTYGFKNARTNKKEVAKTADFSSGKSAFLMRPRLMERSEHKSVAELILGIEDAKDLTPQFRG